MADIAHYFSIRSIVILMGLFFMFYSMYKHKGNEMDRTLLALGCLAMVISLWKLTDNVALYIFSLGTTVLTLILQIMDACDIRQLLWLIYIEWFVACLVLMVIDTGVFYISSSSFLDMVSFIAYVLLMGVFTVRDTKALMEIDIQAQTL